MTFIQHRVYISLPAVTTHANEPQDLKDYWTTIHQICSHRHFFIDSISATTCALIRPPDVEREGTFKKMKVT